MSTALTVTSKQGFYEKLVLNLLSKMQLGTLHLSLPNGQQFTIGDASGKIVASIQVNNSNFFKRCILYGDIGFGESYEAGEWTTDNITDVIKWFLLNIDTAPSISGSKTKNFGLNILKLINKFAHSKRANSIDGSRKNISAHYDLNNDFFSLFLDETMTYSAAYFKQPDLGLKEAQFAKYQRLCEQLNLKQSDHVLEIGSGWGGNAIYMAKHFGCKVTTVTISEEQYKMAQERVVSEQLSDKVTVLLKDYRLLEGRFDKIVSIEMLEAVGHEFYTTYFKKCSDLLKKDGIFALQVITCPDSRFDSLKNNVDWIQKHIFPGSLLPSVAEINKAINATSEMTLVNLKDIGLDYAQTLKLWYEQFNKNLDRVIELGFDESFIRKWNYYFCICEAAFAMRHINVMQLTYTRPNNTNW